MSGMSFWLSIVIFRLPVLMVPSMVIMFVQCEYVYPVMARDIRHMRNSVAIFSFILFSCFLLIFQVSF